MNTSKPPRLVKYPLYTIGDLSSGIYAVTPSILLMFYMTNILGISVGLATVAAVVPKIVDLITNPLVGSLSDRTSTRLGRRRPFILFAGLTVLPTFLFVWAAPFADPVLSACFVVALFSLCSVCYSAFLVPYCALSSELATDYHDSTSLNSYRATYSMLGCVLAGAGAPLIVEQFGGGRAGYLAMGISMGAIMAASVLTTFFASREPVRRTEAVKLTRAQTCEALANNRPYLLLLVAYFMHIVGAGVVGATLAYFVTYVLHRSADFLSLLFFLSFGASVVAIPMFVWLGKRVGKFGAFAVALILSAVSVAAYVCLSSATPVALVLLIPILVGMSEGGIQVFAYAMLADCIRYGDGRSNGLHPGAVLSGFFVAGEKLGFAVGALVAGGIFAMAGLIETQQGLTAQPHSAIVGIRLAASAVPTILNIFALVVFWYYRDFDARVVRESPSALQGEQSMAL
jgi:Na+/melibiose symporter-like transporter